MLVPAKPEYIPEGLAIKIGETFHTDSGMGGSFLIKYVGHNGATGNSRFDVISPSFEHMSLFYPKSLLHKHLYRLVDELDTTPGREGV